MHYFFQCIVTPLFCCYTASFLLVPSIDMSIIGQRQYLPVLVRTRMMASNPMDFSTSRLKSVRKCSLSPWTCEWRTRVWTWPQEDSISQHYNLNAWLERLQYTMNYRTKGRQLPLIRTVLRRYKFLQLFSILKNYRFLLFNLDIS